MRLKHDKKSTDDNNNSNSIIPPYIRKYNRRFKSIYESMHKGSSHDKNVMMNYEKNFRLKKTHGRDKKVYGHFEKYQHDQLYHKNEIPENDILSEIIHKSAKHHKKYHHHKHHHKSHHSNKIKKLRTKPEAGIMQKKIKI